MRSDDLAPLLAAPEVDPVAVRWGQGVVVSWNAETGANVIRWNGVDLTDLPIVAASAWVLTVQPGDTVGLNIIGGGATATVYIVGPITQPGPEVREIIRSAIASNTFSAVVATQQTTGPGGGWVNLATVGPTLSGINVGPSGLCLLTVSAFMSHGGAVISAAHMSFEVNGATFIGPSTVQSLTFGTVTNGWTFGASRTFLLALNPGSHSFLAKYRNDSSAGNASFEQRTLSVVAF